MAYGIRKALIIAREKQTMANESEVLEEQIAALERDVEDLEYGIERMVEDDEASQEKEQRAHRCPADQEGEDEHGFAGRFRRRSSGSGVLIHTSMRRSL